MILKQLAIDSDVNDDVDNDNGNTGNISDGNCGSDVVGNLHDIPASDSGDLDNIAGSDAGDNSDHYDHQTGPAGHAQDVDAYYSTVREDGDQPMEQDSLDRASPRCGDKRPRSRSGSDSDQLRQPVKVHNATSTRPKAADYEPAVRVIFQDAHPVYRSHLSIKTPYPTVLSETKWAIHSWQWACKKCGIQMGFDDGVIKIVSDVAN